jgi:hypothetical protein
MSQHTRQDFVTHTAATSAAPGKCIGIFMPSHSQESDNSVVITLGSWPGFGERAHAPDEYYLIELAS